MLGTMRMTHEQFCLSVIVKCGFIDHFINSAVKDCTFVIHVASPFPMEDPKDEMEVIGPAVEGTQNVLEACAKTKGEVKRVVLTSSCAAIIGKSVVVLSLRKTADILRRHQLHGFPEK